MTLKTFAHSIRVKLVGVVHSLSLVKIIAILQFLIKIVNDRHQYYHGEEHTGEMVR